MLNPIQLILNKFNAQETKVVTGFNQQIPHLGPRLQQINPETLKLYNANQELQAINKRVDFLIYKLVCLFNFLLSKKCDIQLLIK